MFHLWAIVVNVFEKQRSLLSQFALCFLSQQLPMLLKRSTFPYIVIFSVNSDCLLCTVWVAEHIGINENKNSCFQVYILKMKANIWIVWYPVLWNSGWLLFPLLFDFVSHPAVLRAFYSWLCAQGSLLATLGNPYMVLGSATCKAFLYYLSIPFTLYYNKYILK